MNIELSACELKVAAKTSKSGDESTDEEEDAHLLSVSYNHWLCSLLIMWVQVPIDEKTRQRACNYAQSVWRAIGNSLAEPTTAATVTMADIISTLNGGADTNVCEVEDEFHMPRCAIYSFYVNLEVCNLVSNF